MRNLCQAHRGDEDAVATAFADAERAGLVLRKRNTLKISAETYAKTLWRDGVRKGWLS